MHDVPPGFDDLSVDEQIEYVQSLWDRIAATPDAVPVPEAHRRELKERLAAHRRDPDAAIPWPAAKERVEKKLASVDKEK